MTGVLRPEALGVTGLVSGPFNPGVGGNGDPGSGEDGMWFGGRGNADKIADDILEDVTMGELLIG